MRLGAQDGVHVFERAEEACEGVFEMGRAAAGWVEIVAAKLAGARDDGRAHGPVFVRALGPGEVGRRVDPEGESHSTSRACGVDFVIRKNEPGLVRKPGDGEDLVIRKNEPGWVWGRMRGWVVLRRHGTIQE